jgi:hypothetical protein
VLLGVRTVRRRIISSNYFGTRQQTRHSLLHSATHFFPRRLAKTRTSAISTSNQSVILTSGKDLCQQPLPSLPDLSNVPFSKPLLLFPCPPTYYALASAFFFFSQHEFVTTTPSTTSDVCPSSPIFTAHNSLLISHRPTVPLYTKERADGARIPLFSPKW